MLLSLRHFWNEAQKLLQSPPAIAAMIAAVLREVGNNSLLLTITL
jgi:hypothetical protein